MLTAEQAVAVVVARLAGGSGARWVGVDGLGGAGKTSLAALLAVALPGAVVLHVDDFFVPGADGWDRDGFRRAVVEPVLAGRSGRYRRWDWTAGRAGEWLEVPSGRVLVVEGVSATDVRLGLDWSVTLWVDAPAEVRWRRVLARDGEAWRQTWLSDWLPSEEAYVREQQPQARADLVVSGAEEPAGGLSAAPPVRPRPG